MRLLISLVILLNCSAANAVECRRSKGADGWWSWRIIDGQKCWYQGRPGLDKAKLQWSISPSKPANLEGCCWPPLEPESK
jgi:hypothetical protein